MTSIQRIAASLAVSTGLMLLPMIGVEAAPVNATAQKSLGLSEAASNQVELIGRRRGGGREFRGGGGRRWAGGGGGRRWAGRGGGRRWAYGGGGRRWAYGGAGRRWAYRDGGWRWRHRDRWRYRDRFFWGAPFLFGFTGGYSPYYSSYGYSGYGNFCYRECRAFNGPRYCRRFWRRYC